MPKNLMDYRSERYMTVDEFASLLGVTPQTLYGIRAGRRTRPSVVRKIAERLGVHPGDIEEFRIDTENAHRKIGEAISLLMVSKTSIQDSLLKAYRYHLLPLDPTGVPPSISMELARLEEDIESHLKKSTADSEEPTIDSMSEEQAREWAYKLLTLYDQTAR